MTNKKITRDIMITEQKTIQNNDAKILFSIMTTCLNKKALNECTSFECNKNGFKISFGDDISYDVYENTVGINGGMYGIYTPTTFSNIVGYLNNKFSKENSSKTGDLGRE